MNSERFWILMLTLAAFLAGGAGGALLVHETELGAELRADSGRQLPYGPYHERLVRAYGLDEQHAGYLEAALREYADQVDILRQRSLRGLDAELIKAGEDCFSKIREYVIPADRREEFDRLAGGLSVPPSGNPFSSTVQ